VTAQTWLLALVLLALAVAAALWQRASRKRDSETTWRLAGAVARSTAGATPERSAADLLAVVRRLSAECRSWPDILAAINPAGDESIAQKLNALRGPHQFIPHVALNVLEDGCHRALALNLRTGQHAAIDAALRSAVVVVGAGD